ncbi:MAG: SO_0444 family Cu/Zn efflux transporter [Planctomycetes bacterium]|nr:SO_0444 family Cu/Zn efflux transporter [Planctomycetota bacterium]
MDLHPIEIAALLMAASVLGALLPLYRRWSERGLHLFVALAAGVFLGTIFLHLLPHMAGVADHAHVHAHGEEGAGGELGPWIAALCGLLLLFAIEKVWLPNLTESPTTNPHTVLWSATYVGLAMHAITAGFALSAVLDQPDGSTQLLVSLTIHKATETFSLATVMRLAGLSRARMLVMLGLFVLIEPAGFLLGRGVVVGLPDFDSLLTGFACGTFLYVALCDLLPEVFHGNDRPRLKLVAVVVGIAITAITTERLLAAGEFAALVARASLDVFLDLAPYLLLGLLAAGFVSLILKRARLARKIAGNDFKSVFWAALFGAPLPLCSCSVVPVAVSLRKAGASKGATSSFAISTPETGIDSLAVSFVLLDPILAIVRPIGAVVSAIASGMAVNWLVRAKLDSAPEVQHDRAAPEVAACTHDHGVGARHAQHDHGAHGHQHAHAHADSHTHAGAATQVESSTGTAVAERPSEEFPTATVRPERGVVARVLRYAYVEMLDDLTLSLVFGVLVSGAIVAALPATIFDEPLASGFPALLLMLVIGTPLYVCALTSTPIAAALIDKGLSPGAAFVFLLAGPATNAAALFMLSKVLGKRVVVVQLVALSITVVALGWCVNHLYPLFGRTPSAVAGDHAAHGSGWIAIASGVVLGVLMLASLVRTHGSREVLPGLRDSG